MERRRVASKVLLFVGGTAGVVLLVFVSLPWLDTPVQEEGQPPARGAIVEEVLASFGEEESGEGSKTDWEPGEAADLTAFPSPLLPVGAENPKAGPAVESPEATAVMTSGELLAESEQETDKEEDSAAVDILREAQTVVDSTPEDQPSHMAIGSAKAGPVETVETEKEIPPAPAAPEAVNPAALTRIEPAPVVERVRIEHPLPGEVFRQAQVARKSSRAGLPRLEFEMPEGLRIAGTPSLAGDTLTGNEAMAAPGGPLSEFSPRPLARSDVPLAAKAPARNARQSDPVLVPHTLRGVMGYRMPLVSRQEIPDQIVSGVLIPAHTTYVILQPGYWELVGLSPDDVKALRAFAEAAKAAEPATRSEPLARGWNPFRMFRRNTTPANGE